MEDDAQERAYEDKVIFSARYSQLKVWVSIIVVLVFPFFLIFSVACRQLDLGDYLGATLLALPCLGILILVLDTIFFKAMVFYGDHVTKFWHLFGSRSVYYASGAVKSPEWYMRWLSSGHFIVQVRDDGRPVPMRVPIFYVEFFFPSATAQEIARIIDYLSEDVTNTWRIFKKAALPREVICHRN